MSGVSQTPPTLAGRSGGDTRGIGAPWGEFVINLPKAAHVASAAPPATRFGGNRVDFQTVAATRFALDGIGRGEKVLLIGSRWQYRNILAGLEDLVQDLRPHRGKLSWRSRDVSVFDADELQSELLVDDMPDGMQFASFVERARETKGGPRPIRVWNTLGARLHESGNRRAGRAIEHLWHQARQHLGCTILCSYRLPADGLKATFGSLRKSLECHTHVVRPHQGDLVVDRL